MSKKSLLAAIAATALFTPALAIAQTGYNGFMALDSNRDGAVSHQEVESARLALFNRCDTNHDGAISASEQQATQAALQTSGVMAARIDANHDGSISRDEFMSRPYPAFARFDANHDSVLDAAEIQNLRTTAAAYMDYR